MKKIEIKGKLSLNKKVIAKLNNFQMAQIKGGLEPTRSEVNCIGDDDTLTTLDYCFDTDFSCNAVCC